MWLALGWLVLDRVEARDERPRSFEWLWQTPGSVTIDGDGAMANGANGTSLAIEPLGSRPTRVSLASAEHNPYRGREPTGEADAYDPLPTVRVESSDAAGGMKLATLLAPSKGSLRDATFRENEMTVHAAGSGDEFVVTTTDGPAGWIDTVTVDHHSESETRSLSEHVHLAE